MRGVSPKNQNDFGSYLFLRIKTFELKDTHGFF